jgi:hypothetical protein
LIKDIRRVDSQMRQEHSHLLSLQSSHLPLALSQVEIDIMVSGTLCYSLSLFFFISPSLRNSSLFPSYPTFSLPSVFLLHFIKQQYILDSKKRLRVLSESSATLQSQLRTTLEELRISHILTKSTNNSKVRRQMSLSSFKEFGSEANVDFLDSSNTSILRGFNAYSEQQEEYRVLASVSQNPVETTLSDTVVSKYEISSCESSSVILYFLHPFLSSYSFKR